MKWLHSFFKKKPKIIIICGPTATGKTSLSIDLAKKYNGEIVSADSRQIYIGLDIGSAKITTDEMGGIPHYMIDVADPREIFSVQQYTQMTNDIISEIQSRGKTAIIYGGTGMYIDSLVNGTQFPEVPPNYELRKELEKKSTSELYSLLKEKDPRRSQTIDPDNPVRLVRALEVIDTIGAVPKIRKKSKYRTLYIGLDTSKEHLNQRIKKRIIDRFENEEMLQEAINLHKNGLSYERMEKLGLEYRYMARHLQGYISYQEMITQLTTKTIQFAKRQRTWFKRNKKIHWFNPINSQEEVYNLVEKFLK